MNATAAAIEEMRDRSDDMSRDPDVLCRLSDVIAELYEEARYGEAIYLGDNGMAFYVSSPEAFARAVIHNECPDVLCDEYGVVDLINDRDGLLRAIDRYLNDTAFIFSPLDSWGVLHGILAEDVDGNRRDYCPIDEPELEGGEYLMESFDWIGILSRAVDEEPEWLDAYEFGVPVLDLANGLPDDRLA